MKHVLTTREKVLVLVLAVIVIGFCYYNFFLSPLNESISHYNSLATELDTELMINTAKVSQKNSMEKEIEELKTGGASTIPEYNNSQKLMVELNSILSEAEDYNISFDATSNIDYVVLRPAYLTITTAEYQQARDIIDKLYASENIMRMSDLNMTTDESSGKTTVNVRITYFEIDQNYVAPASDDEA